jgi:hypothetical protein
MWLDRAAGSKNVARAAFLGRIVNGTMERGRGRVFVPMVVMVSDLNSTLIGLEVIMNFTYQK